MPEGTEIQSQAEIRAETQYLVQRLFTGLRIQSLVALVLSAGLLMVSPVAAYSSFFGSLAVYLPGMLFTILVGRKIGGSSVAFFRAIMVGEFTKLFMVGLLCALVFIWVKPLSAGYFFVGMILVLAASWVGLAMAFRAPPK